VTNREPGRGKPTRIERIAKQIGATRVERVSDRRVLNPLDLLGLAEVASSRIRSSGGRPTDPELTVRRQIGFKPETWERLQVAARQLSCTGMSVAPAQLAAILIEHGVEECGLGSGVDGADGEEAI
jgi:hypothetical protein